MFNKFLYGSSVTAIAILTATSAMAQVTTSALGGMVSAQDGKPIGGAIITVTHTPSGTKSITKTDAKGNYQLSGLRVGGPFNIEVTAPNFDTNQTTDVYLSLGDVQKLNISLNTSFGQTVIVTGKKRGILSNPGSRTTMTRVQIANVVSYKRDIREAARRDPLTQLDPNTRGTGPSGGLYIAGSAPRANRITIDGVRSNDDFGLNTGGLSTNLGPISLEAVDQMTVQAVPSDVEEGDFTGGAMNLVLRSGSNNFHGSLFTFIRNEHWNGNQLYNPTNKTTKRLNLYVPDENYGAYLSGPILKDRLFLALSYEKYTSATPVAAGPSDGGFGISLLNGGVPFTNADLNNLLSLWTPYAASQKLPAGSWPLTTPFEDEKYSAKLDWNIMDGQRASFTYRHAFSNVWKATPASSSALYMNTNWYTQPETEDNYAWQLNSRWNDAFSTEARIAIRHYQRGQMPPEGQGFSGIQVCADVTSAGTVNSCSSGKLVLNFGPDQFRQANVLKTINNSAQFTGTYRAGNHSIKAGYQGKQIHVYNLFVQAANGLYYFDSQDDFSNGKVNQLYYNNYPTGETQKAAADFYYTNHALFAQDTFDPITNLTVNYGLRLDMWDQQDRPAFNTNFYNRYGYSNTKTYNGLSVLQPRLGAKWHNDTFDASGSFGLYTGGLPDVFISNRFGNTGVLTATFTLVRQADGTFKETNSGTIFAANDPLASSLMNINKADANFASGVPSSAISLLSLNPGLVRVANTNSIAPNFEMPSDWKFNFNGHWHAPFGTTFGVDGVIVRANTGLAFRDLRARPLTINGVQQYTPDGRMRYDGLVIAATTGTTLDEKNLSIYNNRVAAGLDVATNGNGSPNYDLANPGSGYDIQAYNPSTKSSSQTIAVNAQHDWHDLLIKNDSLDLYASATYQHTSQFGGIPEFATTDCCGGSNYGDQFSFFDPNAPAKGKSSFEIRSSYKMNATYKFSLFGDNQTSITLFGDSHDGRPLSFYVADAGSNARGQVFGVVSNNQMAFIPQTDTSTVINGKTTYVTNGVPVTFATAADLTNLQKIIGQFGLPTGVQSIGSRSNPDVTRFDLHLAQEVNVPYLRGNKVTVTLDFYNIGNLFDKKWGNVREYGSDGRQGTPVYKIACTDANMNVVSSSSATCAGYQISNVSSTFTTPTVNQYATLHSVMLGLKLSF